ncbi:methyltransferase domain-containing protein [Solidesulfovibrio sp. C21]|uniref:methyltransferase domain-containing protein n=1 Tax=Solidesulfovibrio sp. C21 TaxID=3398613 RepID=UPI0039FD19CD
MQDLKKYIKCPGCGGKLLSTPEQHSCQSCGRIFLIENGIHMLLFPPEKKTIPFYDDPDYKKYLSQITRLHAAHYKKGSLTARIESSMKNALRNIAKPAIPPYIDLGCGIGSGFSSIGKDKDIIGIDNNLKLLKHCRSLHPDATLIYCDMLMPPLVQGVFQNIFCLNTLEHIFYLESFIESTANILDKNGHMYVAIPTEGGLAWSLGRFLLTTRRNSKLLGIDYLKAIKKDHCNTVFSVNSALQKHFSIDILYQYPFRFCGANVNISFIYRLSKLLSNSHDDN